MKNRKKVNGYINPELPNMEETHKKAPTITIPKTLKECETVAERVMCSCVMLFQTSGKPYDKPDPYDQTIRIKRGRITSNIDFDMGALMPSEPRGEGACEAFERDLNAFENDMDNPDYADQWE